MTISKLSTLFMALIVTILMLLSVQVNAAVTSEYNWKDHGNLLFYKTGDYESLLPVAPVYFYDDFLGADVVIPAAGSDESGCKWAKDTLGSATVAKGTDATNGTVVCTLTSASATEEAFLCMDDQRNFTIGQGLIFEARIKLSVLPSAAASEAFIGIGSDTDTVTGEVADRLCFHATGSGLLYAECDDQTTDSSVTTGTTLTTSDWAILRIDATSASDVKFYIDGERVAGSTTFAFAGLTTHLTLQPWIGVKKSTGTTLGAITIDYVRIWQDRS